MAIIEITDTEVVQRCPNCDLESRHRLDSIKLDLQPEVAIEELRVVPLPPCPTCGCTEHLVRSADDEPEHTAPGSFGHLHRMLVDHLCSELVKANQAATAPARGKGKAAPTAAKLEPPRAGKPLDKATREKFFPKGMKIDQPRPPPARLTKAAAAPPAAPPPPSRKKGASDA